MDTKNLLSYTNILKERDNFRRSELLDAPSTFFFKIMFYFNNPGDENSGYTSNLLGLDLNDTTITDDISTGAYNSTASRSESNSNLQNGMSDGIVSQNTAYNFLKLNDEQERADMLKNFIFMLSEISSEYPWYFKSIEGLDEANKRPYLKEFKIEDRRTITISCLQDSVDTRISTMLELYRGACFSHALKKEIVPANLRKFDMGVYIFQTPINSRLYSNTDKEIRVNKSNSTESFANARYYEFHNCEIDLDSLSTFYNDVSNENGFISEPKITINYDDCYISSYNEDLCEVIGDVVKIDIDRNYNSYNTTDKTKREMRELNRESSESKHITEYDLERKNYISPKLYINPDYKYRNNGNLSQLLVDSTLGKLGTKLESVVQKAYLGNVYGVSIRNMVGSVQQIASGDIIGGVQSATRQVENTVSSVAQGNVVSDLLPSVITKKKNITVKNIFRNI